MDLLYRKQHVMKKLYRKRRVPNWIYPWCTAAETWWLVTAAYWLVYDLSHLQLDCLDIGLDQL